MLKLKFDFGISCNIFGMYAEKNKNESSLIVRINFDNFGLLILGDCIGSTFNRIFTKAYSL